MRFLAIYFAFFAALQVSAQVNSTQITNLAGSSTAPGGFWIFAGGNASFVNSDVVDGIYNADGLGIRGLVSYYAPTMIYDGGLNLEAIKIGTLDRFNVGALDLAARYRVSDRMAVGGELATFFNPGREFFGAQESVNPFLGIGVIRDIPTERGIVRIGGRAMADTSIEGVTATFAQVYLQMGLGAAQSFRTAQYQEDDAQELALDDQAVASEELSLESDDAGRSDKTGRMEVATFQFDLSSAVLKAANEKRLKEIARALNNNRQLFERMEIVGHADASGTDAINDKLSKSRAITVAEVMRSAGLRSSELMGKGSRQPKSSVADENRRVEIILHGVKNSAALEQVIQSIKQ